MVFLAFETTSQQKVSDVSLRELNKCLKDESLTVTDRVRIREYKTATFGAHNHRRKVSDEGSRDQDAVRKQIERAIAAIARKAPRCAKFLKENIVNIGDGAWWFKGNRDEWDTGPSEEDLFRMMKEEEDLFRTTNEEEQVQFLTMNEEEQVQFLRQRWFGKQAKPTPRRPPVRTHRLPSDETVSHPVSRTPVIHRRCGNRILDEDEEITPEGRSKSRGDPVCLCHGTGTFSGRTPREKVIREMDERCGQLRKKRDACHAWWEVKPDTDKSLKFNRPAYTSRGANGVDHEEDQNGNYSEEAPEEAGRGSKADRFELGDDRDAEDYEN